jgi:two-component system chemotaxis response regulator CheV
MRGHDNILKVGTNEMEMVDFRILRKIGDDIYEGIYGVNVAKVREIIRVPKLTELPGVPTFIEGIFDLRGVVIPVVNLAKWMGIDYPEEAENESRVIIAEFNNILIGFVVHEARRIRRVNWKDIEPATFTSGVSDSTLDRSKITGVTRIENDEVLLVLDLESVVQELGLYEPKESTNDEVDQFKGMALLLDDSSIARRTIKKALEKMGFQVVEAGDGQDGLDKLNELYDIYEGDIQRQIKIIISDVEMPRMDGFHFAANVKEDPRFNKIPIVFNSSISDHFSEDRGKNAGGESYLVKFDPNVFYKEVSRVINENEANVA